MYQDLIIAENNLTRWPGAKPDEAPDTTDRLTGSARNSVCSLYIGSSLAIIPRLRSRA